MFAVEATATGGAVLVAITLLTCALTWPQWQTVLADTLSLSGTLLVMLIVAQRAGALDAFEMIFVIIPIVAPLPTAGLGDAQQTTVLLLLVLHLSFVIPPVGYRIMMTRSRSGLTTVSNSISTSIRHQ